MKLGKVFNYKCNLFGLRGRDEHRQLQCDQIKLGKDDNAKDKFDCRVVTVVTDNEKKIEKIRSNLVAENKDLIAYGRSAHWFSERVRV